jgi:hypothetical protein
MKPLSRTGSGFSKKLLSRNLHSQPTKITTLKKVELNLFLFYILPVLD